MILGALLCKKTNCSGELQLILRLKRNFFSQDLHKEYPIENSISFTQKDKNQLVSFLKCD